MGDRAAEAGALQASIVALEQQRGALGDEVVDRALEPLRARLAALTGGGEPGELAGERKVVTILFADVSGFTALAERLDPEAVRALMNRCFERMVPIVHRHGGTIDKFIGDAVLALFGAPVTRDKDAQRALYAALELREAIQSLASETGFALSLHVGVNTGLVVAGEVGSADRHQYSVMGDAVNLAARLEDASTAGQILVGPETRRLAAAEFRFEPLPAMALKGKSEPVPVHALLGPVEAAAAAAGGEAPFTGRDAELERVLAAARRAAGGQGRMVLLEGEGGTGKTRLAQEVSVRAPGLRWIRVSGSLRTAHVSYAGTGEIVCGLLGAGRGPERMAARLRSLLGTSPDGHDLGVELLAAAVEREPDPGDDLPRLAPDVARRLIGQAFQGVVEASARAGALGILLDDQQWADPSSQDLLEALRAACADAPLLVLVAYRPQEGFTRARELVERGAERVVLGPLSRDETVALASAVLLRGSVPPARLREIADRAGGNPLFAIELGRALRERSDPGATGWEPDAAPLPPSLQALAASRLDRLPPPVKRAVQLASVLGVSFRQDLFQAVADRGGTATLGGLVALGLVRPGSRPGEFAFEQRALQAAAYDGLLLSARQQLHGRAAAELERLQDRHGPEVAIELGRHWRRAGLPARALGHYERSARHAVGVYAPDEAIEAFERALACLEEAVTAAAPLDEPVGAVTARLQEGLGDALALRSRWSDARAALQRAMPHATEPVVQARLIRKVAGTLAGEIRTGEAGIEYARADALLRALPEEVAASELAQVRLEHLWALYLENRDAQLAELLAATRPLVNRHGNAAQRSLLHHRSVNAAFRRDRYVIRDATLADAHAALEAASEAGDPGTICRSYHVVGFCHLWRLENQEAERPLQLSADLASRIGDRAQELRALVYLALAERRLGKLAEARRHCDVVVEAGAEYTGVARSIRAWIPWLAGGDGAETRDDAERAMREILAQFNPSYPFRWIALLPLIDAALASGDLDRALEHARVVHDPPQQRLTVLEPDLAAALRAAESGAREQASAALARVVATARERL